ncbi:MAG: hypothetical protein BWX52_01925 [Bacteroidetes bacterium ADurb.Bin013]|nr:MAG: hypothetical protein BWX52_01925 [Bacteroidetes bacterium ADurb.Bin013]
MYCLGFPVLEAGADHGILVSQLGRGPLLELNDDDLFLLCFVQPGYDKVYALGSERDLELNGYAGVRGYFIVPKHVAHVHHGICPRQDLVGRGVPAQVVIKSLIDLGINFVVQNIFQKTFLCGLVNNHSIVFLKAFLTVILTVRYIFLRFHELFPGGIFVRF